MDYQEFYKNLFAPLEAAVGRLDRDTIVAIVGFDAGGPLNFCTIGAQSRSQFVTYVSCELAVRAEQVPSEFGRYELLVSCDDERWVCENVSEIGRMSLEVAFGHGHTLDIGPWVEEDAALQGVLFEKVCSTRVAGEPCGVLRCIGLTRAELEYAQDEGAAPVLALLKKAGIYPHAIVRRQSTI